MGQMQTMWTLKIHIFLKDKMNNFFKIHVYIFVDATNWTHLEKRWRFLTAKKFPLQDFNIAVQMWTKVELVFMHFSKSTDTILFKKDIAAVYWER